MCLIVSRSTWLTTHVAVRGLPLEAESTLRPHMHALHAARTGLVLPAALSSLAEGSTHQLNHRNGLTITCMVVFCRVYAGVSTP